MKKKKLSIILCCRNDNYNGNFKWRFHTCLKFLEHSIIKNNLSKILDIVVVDWNSETPLSEDFDFPSKIIKIIKVLNITPSFLEKNRINKMFNTPMSVNSAIRRVKSEYVLFMSSDNLLTAPNLNQIMKIINKNKVYVDPNYTKDTMYFLSRKFIPEKFVLSDPDFQSLNKFITTSSRMLRSTNQVSGVSSGAGGFLSTTEFWKKIGGLPSEIQKKKLGWMDIELGIRAGNHGNILNTDFFGIYLYDLEINYKRNLFTFSENKYSDISKNWGLANKSLKLENINNKKKISLKRNHFKYKISLFKIINSLFKSRKLKLKTIIDLLLIFEKNKKINEINIFNPDDISIINFILCIDDTIQINYFINKNYKNWENEYIHNHFKLYNDKIKSEIKISILDKVKLSKKQNLFVINKKIKNFNSFVENNKSSTIEYRLNFIKLICIYSIYPIYFIFSILSKTFFNAKMIIKNILNQI